MKLNEKNFNRESLMSILSKTKDVVIVSNDANHILVEAKSALPFQELFTLGETTTCCFSLDKPLAFRTSYESGQGYFNDYMRVFGSTVKCKQYILFDLTKPFGSISHFIDEKCPFKIKSGCDMTSYDIQQCEAAIVFTTYINDGSYDFTAKGERYGYFNNNEVFYYCFDRGNNDLLENRNKDRFERLKQILSSL
jgi:hypothetical protein